MEKICDSFKIDELEGKAVIDFLPSVISVSEKNIMDQWKKYFMNHNVPFAIAKEWIVTKERYNGAWKYKMYKLEKTGEDIGISIFFRSKFGEGSHA